MWVSTILNQILSMSIDLCQKTSRALQCAFIVRVSYENYDFFVTQLSIAVMSTDAACYINYFNSIKIFEKKYTLQ